MTPMWKCTVAISCPDGWRVVEGPRQALRLLDREWPGLQGNQYWAAKRACYSALAQTLPVDASRKMFLAAAIESDILFI